jgi:molecular chaperone DnaK (HSP70)
MMDVSSRKFLIFVLCLRLVTPFFSSLSLGASRLHRNHARNFVLSSNVPAGRSCGIDLGTTFSLVSVIEKGKPILLPIDGANILPSVVTYVDNKILVGKPAVEAGLRSPQNCFSSVKRVIGRTQVEAKKSGDSFVFGKRLRPLPKTLAQLCKSFEGFHPDFSSPNDKVKEAALQKLKNTGFSINTDDFCGLYCESLKRILNPEEISAEILKKLILRAEEYYKGEKVTKAVITVPAYFSQDQMQATTRAGELAGLQKIKILREPEAAAVAYGLTQEVPHLVLVIDLGGGTFDVSVLEVGDGLVEVIGSNGDSHLGGDDFDKAIVDWVLTQSRCITPAAEQHIRTNLTLFNQVKRAATEAKHVLSTQETAKITMPKMYHEEGIRTLLTRKKFNQLIDPLIQRMLKPLRQLVLMCNVNLPGESGQVYDSKEDEEELKEMIREEKEFENDQITGNSEQTSYEQSKMTMGALTSKSMIRKLQKQQLEGKKKFRAQREAKHSLRKQLNRLRQADRNVQPFPGGQPLGDVLLVGGATRMKCILDTVKVLTHIDPKRHVHPDEAVALGAGIFAGTLDGTVQGLEIIDPLKSSVIRFYQELKERGDLTKGTEEQLLSPVPLSKPFSSLRNSLADSILNDDNDDQDYDDDDEKDEEEIVKQKTKIKKGKIRLKKEKARVTFAGTDSVQEPKGIFRNSKKSR